MPSRDAHGSPRYQKALFIQLIYSFRIREFVNFELAKGIEKYVFRIVTSVGQRKNSESP